MTSINLDQAQAIISGALAKAAEANMNKLCVVVLDAGGRMVAMVRQDGVPFGRNDVAYAKAFGSLAVGMNSRSLEGAALDRPHFMAGVIGAIGGPVVPVAGGVIVYDAHGSRIGAVGASGDTSDNDETAVMAGIESAGLKVEG